MTTIDRDSGFARAWWAHGLTDTLPGSTPGRANGGDGGRADTRHLTSTGPQKRNKNMQAEPRIFLPIPTGSYPAKIKGVEQVEGQYGPQWKWTFDLGTVENVEEEMEEKTLTYYTPNYITAANKLGLMLSALGIPTDEVFESGDIIGKSVTLTVIEAPRKDGSIGNNIEAVLAPRKKKAGANGAAAPAKKPAKSADEDEGETTEDDDGTPW